MIISLDERASILKSLEVGFKVYYCRELYDDIVPQAWQAERLDERDTMDLIVAEKFYDYNDKMFIKRKDGTAISLPYCLITCDGIMTMNKMHSVTK